MFVDAPFRARVCAALLMAIVLLPSLAAAQRGARGSISTSSGFSPRSAVAAAT